ncbi:MAG: lysophospholipase [Roseiarcus sp.]|jgi:alpha-beta hydrolase superfamily lysophospholipase
MRSSPFAIERDGATIAVRRWLPDGAPRAAVQIAHGLAEHSARYERLAVALTGAGYAVYASDHRGHGPACPAADLGFFAAEDGWRKCLDDLWAVNRRIAADLPELPIVFMGHSLGSIMGQQFIAEHGAALAGAVLSATSGTPPAILPLGRLLARFERWRLGPLGHSALLRKMLFEDFNKPFKPARTDFDWLSRDPGEVDKYIADPLCGFAFTVQLAIDLLDAIGPIASKEMVARVPKTLPIYIFSGARDPVGVQLQGLLEAYRDAGLTKVTTRIYPDAHHEMLNETNRDEVTADLIDWLKTIG